MLRFLTAGESHGKALVTIIEGVPAGLAIDFDALTAELRRRQTGYGRGRRMLIESDRAEPLSGIRHGADHRRSDRAADSEQGLGELAAHDVRGTGDAGRRVRRRSPAGDPSASRPRRPRRLREVRPRRHAQRPRARQRARNRGARRRRRHRAAAAAPRRRRDRQPRRPRSDRRRSRDPLADHVRAGRARSRPTRRSTAPTRRSSSR